MDRKKGPNQTPSAAESMAIPAVTKRRHDSISSDENIPKIKRLLPNDESDVAKEQQIRKILSPTEFEKSQLMLALLGVKTAADDESETFEKRAERGKKAVDEWGLDWKTPNSNKMVYFGLRRKDYEKFYRLKKIDKQIAIGWFLYTAVYVGKDSIAPNRKNQHYKNDTNFNRYCLDQRAKKNAMIWVYFMPDVKYKELFACFEAVLIQQMNALLRPALLNDNIGLNLTRVIGVKYRSTYRPHITIWLLNSMFENSKVHETK